SWLKGGCLASEMESATLYIVAASLGLRAGCVLHAVWNQERRKAGLADTQCESTEKAVKTAINALKILINS
ncbi:MAG: uridine phosphorylase, partial [Clostridia bacterium]|nr:uridine phosphorylase [Clostridia bacterium]